MPSIAVLSQTGENVKTIELSETVFATEANMQVVYDVVYAQRASLRQGTHDTKNRTEVSGGGRKPWRQKGTGRARQGSIRATQWRGGGIAGGVVPRDYTFKMNKKERSLALKSALTDKVNNKELIVVDSLAIADSKTKTVKELIKTLGLDGKVLFVTADEAANLYLATRNLGYVYTLMSDEINCYDLVNADYVVVEEAAVKMIEEALK